PADRGRRPVRYGEGAGARVGFDVRADRCRRTAGAQGRRADRTGPSETSEPVPAEPRRGAEALRPGGGPGDEPRPAGDAAEGEVPGRRRVVRAGPWPATRRRGTGAGDRQPGRGDRRRGDGWQARRGRSEPAARGNGERQRQRIRTGGGGGGSAMSVDLGFPGLHGVPAADGPQNRKEFVSDQEVRWCPGCGDYAVLAAFQSFLPELGVKRENVVMVSGIGCSSRFPYYLSTYGVHSIHGRAPTIATGLAVTRPDLSVWVITGDGDALSIGGNHLIHTMRRNVNLKILLFNNRIYGLTKGQYSPTSERGKVTKSTPMGSADTPFNPISLALGAEAKFVARTIDSDRKHLTEVLRAAAAHRGTAFVEIYQNCPIFNDNAFDAIKDPETRDDAIIPLVHGRPIRFGRDG